MNENDEVALAFKIVLEEIEEIIDAINQQGAHALQHGRYDTAETLIEKGKQISSFRSKVQALKQEWLGLFAPESSLPPGRQRRKVRERLERGLRTPEAAFYVPILQSLTELGGTASMSDVLQKVEAKLGHQLNRYDRSTLPSDPTQVRWRNTAQWARKFLVTEGLLSANSPRGNLGNHRNRPKMVSAGSGRQEMTIDDLSNQICEDINSTCYWLRIFM